MSRKDVPSIITESFSEITCSSCQCKIDVECVDPFTKIECPECRDIAIVPAKFDNFTLLDVLGSGQMGSVYLAKDNSLNRNVAIKVMKPSLSEDENFVETFSREAQALAKLNHPNVAQIYSFGEKNGQYYLVMELIKGRKLQDMMQGKKQLDQAIAMYIGLQIMKGLKVVGEAGLVHGDVKPENIVVDEKFNAKLVDFGLAVFNEDGPLKGVWGSPYYIAPEKLSPGKVDVRSDIYSLGATLYHIVAGKPPFTGETPAECAKIRLKRDARDIAVLRRDINPSVKNIIMRMIERDLARRYPSNCASLMGDMVKAIKELGGISKLSRPKVNIKSKTSRLSSSGTRSIAKTIVTPSSKSGKTSSIPVSKPVKSGNPLKTVMIIIFAIIGIIIFASVLADKNRRSRSSAPVSYDPAYKEEDVSKQVTEWKKNVAKDAKEASGAGSVSTIVFSDGVSPTASYKGTKDAFIVNISAVKKSFGSENLGRSSRLFVGRNPDDEKTKKSFEGFILIKWDVSAIPRGSKVNDVSLSFHVTQDDSKGRFQIYKLKRAWNEDEVMWNVCKKGSEWGELGAKSSSDKGSELLSQLFGVKKLTRNVFKLNKAGISVVQNWIDNPAINYGFRIEGGPKDGASIYSREVSDVKLRPQLIIKYSH